MYEYEITAEHTSSDRERQPPLYSPQQAGDPRRFPFHGCRYPLPDDRRIRSSRIHLLRNLRRYHLHQRRREAALLPGRKT